MAFLNERLGRLASIEISKLTATNRPTNFGQILHGEVPHWEINPYTFTKSDDWVYWDEEIHGWYKVWEDDSKKKPIFCMIINRTHTGMGEELSYGGGGWVKGLKT